MTSNFFSDFVNTNTTTPNANSNDNILKNDVVTALIVAYAAVAFLYGCIKAIKAARPMQNTSFNSSDVAGSIQRTNRELARNARTGANNVAACLVFGALWPCFLLKDCLSAMANCNTQSSSRSQLSYSSSKHVPADEKECEVTFEKELKTFINNMANQSVTRYLDFLTQTRAQTIEIESDALKKDLIRAVKHAYSIDHSSTTLKNFSKFFNLENLSIDKIKPLMTILLKEKESRGPFLESLVSGITGYEDRELNLSEKKPLLESIDFLGKLAEQLDKAKGNEEKHSRANNP